MDEFTTKELKSTAATGFLLLGCICKCCINGWLQTKCHLTEQSHSCCEWPSMDQTEIWIQATLAAYSTIRQEQQDDADTQRQRVQREMSFRQVPSRAGALERPGLFLTAAVSPPRMLGLFWCFLSSFIEKQILGSSHWDWLCCKTTSSPLVPNDLLDPGQEVVLVALRALISVADNRSISKTYQSHIDLFVLTKYRYLNNLFFLVSRRLHQGLMSFWSLRAL